MEPTLHRCPDRLVLLSL